MGEVLVQPSSNSTLKIAVFPGDGIGPEVMDPCIVLLEDLAASLDGLSFDFTSLPAGADHFRATGEALPEASVAAAAGADAILLGAMGDPAVRYPDGREIAPQVDLRERFALFAGVRPIVTYPGMRVPLADPRAQHLDVVLIREQTEGLFAGRDTGTVTGDTAQDTLTITRAASERLFDFAFDLARKRRAAGRAGEVTCVDKANIFRSFAFFRGVFDAQARHFPDVVARHAYVDAAALKLVTQPWAFDVMVTENLLGDILSDMGAGLMGGMGMAPSADIGPDHAVFQPCHGTAPDIAGTGRANPTAMFLSAAMMLDWLAERHEAPAAATAGRLLDGAVRAAFAGGDLHPFEQGGSDGVAAVTDAVRRALERQPVATSGT